MRKKLLILSIFMLLIYGLFSVNVSAAETITSATITLTTSKTVYNAGDTVEFTVSLKNLDASVGISGFSAIVNYDSDVLELNRTARGVGDWSNGTISSKTNKFDVTRNPAYSENNEDIAKITFTAKSVTEAKNLTVSLTSIQLSNRALYRASNAVSNQITVNSPTPVIPDPDPVDPTPTPGGESDPQPPESGGDSGGTGSQGENPTPGGDSGDTGDTGDSGNQGGNQTPSGDSGNSGNQSGSQSGSQGGNNNQGSGTQSGGTSSQGGTQSGGTNNKPSTGNNNNKGNNNNNNNNKGTTNNTVEAPAPTNNAVSNNTINVTNRTSNVTNKVRNDLAIKNGNGGASDENMPKLGASNVMQIMIGVVAGIAVILLIRMKLLDRKIKKDAMNHYYEDNDNDDDDDFDL